MLNYDGGESKHFQHQCGALADVDILLKALFSLWLIWMGPVQWLFNWLSSYSTNKMSIMLVHCTCKWTFLSSSAIVPRMGQRNVVETSACLLYTSQCFSTCEKYVTSWQLPNPWPSAMLSVTKTAGGFLPCIGFTTLLQPWSDRVRKVKVRQESIRKCIFPFDCFFFSSMNGIFLLTMNPLLRL